MYARKEKSLFVRRILHLIRQGYRTEYLLQTQEEISSTLLYLFTDKLIGCDNSDVFIRNTSYSTINKVGTEERLPYPFLYQLHELEPLGLLFLCQMVDL